MWRSQYQTVAAVCDSSSHRGTQLQKTGDNGTEEALMVVVIRESLESTNRPPTCSGEAVFFTCNIGERGEVAVGAEMVQTLDDMGRILKILPGDKFCINRTEK